MTAAKKAPTKGAFQVVAPLVQAKFGERVLHYYKGDVLPDGIDEDSIKNLKDLGYIAEVEAPESDSE